ncbi:hypothetical protein PUN28_010973 [Cardiocondyla obscurior]|uniref:Uncharacterized protein n=1 Tax=Cardiocondyla obscurior TaxID=286306 RepID=A0AAW2FLZ1_9HYME
MFSHSFSLCMYVLSCRPRLCSRIFVSRRDLFIKFWDFNLAGGNSLDAFFANDQWTTSPSERRSRPRKGILFPPDNVVIHRSVFIADLNEKRTVGGSSVAFTSRVNFL